MLSWVSIVMTFLDMIEIQTLVVVIKGDLDCCEE